MIKIILIDQQVTAIAHAVAERVTALTAKPTNGLISAAELAELLGTTRAFVYEHATELGAVRLGSGPRALLRFDPAVARGALNTTTITQHAPPRPPKPPDHPIPGTILKIRPR